MVSLVALWLPIVLSAVIIFIASSIIHMGLKYHQFDYRKLPNEGGVLEAMRKAGIGPGNYAFPYPDNLKDRNSPEMLEKYKQGPLGMVNIFPTGPPAMGKQLVQWFILCAAIAIFAAYLAGRTLDPGTEYLTVFRVTGTITFLGFAAGQVSDSIWYGQSWMTTVRHAIDALIYALLTGGVFGWLWPQ